MVTPWDAKKRRLVRLPDGREGRLVFAPPPIGEEVRSVPHTGRGAYRCDGRAVVVVGGRHVRLFPHELHVIPTEVAS